jgi:putative PIN family toxin of toxin-antitoxin system
MRLVLDTNVVVAALLWSGPPQQLLASARERRVELFTSTPLLAELTDVLARPKFAPKIAASQLSVDELVDRYAALATVVRPATIPRVASDPDDDVVIATALAAKAEFVVTGDRSLLATREYQGVRIASIAEIVRLNLAPP